MASERIGQMIPEATLLAIVRESLAGDGRLILAALLGALGGIVLARAAKKLQGGTLFSPWAWSCFSLAALTAAEAAVAISGAPATSIFVAHVRYLAATTTVAPLIALLGAKRPQDRAWQWIVASLLALLALPSLKAWAFDGGPPSPHAAWRWLLTAILTAELLNFAPTRFGLAAGLLVLGQFIELAAYLPGFFRPLAGWDPIWGLALPVAALLVAWLAAWRKKPAAEPVDRLWLDFRDAFGALWALRVAERFNASAAQYGWHVWLAWGGLRLSRDDRLPDHAIVGPLAPEVRQGMHQALKSLLWRFVSADWIAERLESDQRCGGK
ncbi:MAG TPA: hypothetical protein VMV10_11275 [Pirellulales bacterium]|nr:hypothetical protein [Pirellulales bacterium]